MKILYLCQRVPYPPDRGDRIPVYHHIKHLCRNHEVVVASLAGPGMLQNARDLQNALGISLIVPRHSRIHQAAGMVACLLQRKPLTIGYFQNRDLFTEIDSLLRKSRFDAIIVFSSSMAQYVESVDDTPRIMNFCDVDSQKWLDMAKDRNPMMRWIYKREGKLLRRYEKRLAGEFSISCVVTQNEAKLFRKYIPDCGVTVLENGVDVDYFSQLPRRQAGLKFVYVGVMDYPPNEEAVSYFAEKIWPRILAVHPGACFSIVGSRPSRAVQRLGGQPGIEVTGYVSDIRPYLSSATLVPAPLGIARGIQNKILEAMAAGAPVLTTPEVAGGLAPEARSKVFIAERDPQIFASTLLGLIADRNTREARAADAQTYIRKTGSWDSKLEILDSLLDQVSGNNIFSYQAAAGVV